MRRVAYEHATGLERRVQPLMRIDRDRIGLRERAQVRRSAGNPRGQRTVCPIHVEPQVVLAADRLNLGKRVDRASTDRAGRAHHEEGMSAVLPIELDLASKL